MRLSYHRLAIRDVRQILDYYESEAGADLAGRFFAELLATIGKAIENPRRFPPVGEVLRRANLGEFPYHVLYEEVLDGIRVLVIRHDRRDPRYGTKRR